MSISDKLRQSLSIEISHYLNCKMTNYGCPRCNKLLKDMRALKHV